MKTAPLAALLVSAATFAAAFAASPAFAQQGAAPVAGNGAKTRAEVKAELARACASGEWSLNPDAPGYPQRFATGGYAVPRVQR